ncbi:InlB B-repeat-containing protein [Persephonella sp.]
MKIFKFELMGLFFLILTFSILSFPSKAVVISDGPSFVQKLNDLSNQQVLPGTYKIQLSGVISITGSPPTFNGSQASNRCAGTNLIIESLDPNKPAIIDGNGQSALLIISNCGNNSVTIRNVIFSNGIGTTRISGSGSVIIDTEDGDIIVENSIFQDNLRGTVQAADGGLRLKSYGNGKIILRKNKFYGNTGNYSGAAFLEGASIIVENNLFTRNYVDNLYGGALKIVNIAKSGQIPYVRVVNNTIYGNYGNIDLQKTLETTSGVGLSLSFNNSSNQTAKGYIYNNIIYNNGINTDIPGGVYKGLQVYIANTPNNPVGQSNKVFLFNNDIGIDPGIFKNYGKDLSLNFTTGQSQQLWIDDNSNTGYSQFANLSVNPQLIKPLHHDMNIPVDYSKGNYKLKITSPLIDSGYFNNSFPEVFPKSDIDGEKRPLDGNGDNIPAYDIGFDEVDFLNYPKRTINISTAGGGHVKYPSSGSYIDCPTKNCSYSTFQYTEITLEAVPLNGYTLDSWGLDCSGCLGTKCKITLDTDKNCTVSFLQGSPTSITLNINPKPSIGTVQTKNTGDIICGSKGSKCSKQVNIGDQITLEAVADTGYEFDKWDGDCGLLCSDIKNPVCSFTVPKGSFGLSCSALFKQTTANQFTLQIDINGPGEVNVSYQTNNQTCKQSCQYTVNQGEDVILEVVPSSGNIFKGWVGDCSSPCKVFLPKCQITIQGNTGCEARFGKPNQTNNNNNNNNNTNNNNQNNSGNNSNNQNTSRNNNQGGGGGGGGCSFGAAPSLELTIIALYLLAIKKIWRRRWNHEKN